MSDLFYFTSEKGFPKWDNSLAVEWLLKNEGKKCYADLGRETGVRTLNQNSALHLGLQMIADSLNNSGNDMRKVLKPEVDIPFAVESVKEFLWRPIQKAMYQKKSTTELSKMGEIEAIWEVLLRHLGEKFEIEWIPFPSEANKNKP